MQSIPLLGSDLGYGPGGEWNAPDSGHRESSYQKFLRDVDKSHHSQVRCWKEMGGYRANGIGGMWTLRGSLSEQQSHCEQVNATERYYSGSVMEKLNSELTTTDRYGDQLMNVKSFLKLKKELEKRKIAPELVFSSVRQFRNLYDLPIRSSVVSQTLNSYVKSLRSNQFLCRSHLMFVDTTAAASTNRFFYINLINGTVKSAKWNQAGDKTINGKRCTPSKRRLPENTVVGQHAKCDHCLSISSVDRNLLQNLWRITKSRKRIPAAAKSAKLLATIGKKTTQYLKKHIGRDIDQKSCLSFIHFYQPEPPYQTYRHPSCQP